MTVIKPPGSKTKTGPKKPPGYPGPGKKGGGGGKNQGTRVVKGQGKGKNVFKGGKGKDVFKVKIINKYGGGGGAGGGGEEGGEEQQTGMPDTGTTSMLRAQGKAYAAGKQGIGNYRSGEDPSESGGGLTAGGAGGGGGGGGKKGGGKRRRARKLVKRFRAPGSRGGRKITPRERGKIRAAKGKTAGKKGGGKKK